MELKLNHTMKYPNKLGSFEKDPRLKKDYNANLFKKLRLECNNDVLSESYEYITKSPEYPQGIRTSHVLARNRRDDDNENPWICFCICGHWINRAFFIRHVKSEKVLIVGSKCIKRFGISMKRICKICNNVCRSEDLICSKCKKNM